MSDLKDLPTSNITTQSNTPIFSPIINFNDIDKIIDNLNVLSTSNKHTNLPTTILQPSVIIRPITKEDSMMVIIKSINLDKLNNEEYDMNDITYFITSLGLNITGSHQYLNRILYNYIITVKNSTNISEQEPIKIDTIDSNKQSTLITTPKSNIITVKTIKKTPTIEDKTTISDLDKIITDNKPTTIKPLTIKILPLKKK